MTAAGNRWRSAPPWWLGRCSSTEKMTKKKHFRKRGSLFWSSKYYFLLRLISHRLLAEDLRWAPGVFLWFEDIGSLSRTSVGGSRGALFTSSSSTAVRLSVCLSPLWHYGFCLMLHRFTGACSISRTRSHTKCAAWMTQKTQNLDFYHIVFGGFNAWTEWQIIRSMDFVFIITPILIFEVHTVYSLYILIWGKEQLLSSSTSTGK